MKPKIIIISDEGYKNNLCHYIINSVYGSAISNAGGLPLVALSEKLLYDYFNLCDGITLTDGASVHAKEYGEFYKTEDDIPELSRKHDIIDFSLLELAVKTKKPVLAIGRGLNVVNAFFGGSLQSENGKQTIKNLCDDLIVNGNYLKHKTLPIFALDCTPDKLLNYSNVIDEFITACKEKTL